MIIFRPSKSNSEVNGDLRGHGLELSFFFSYNKNCVFYRHEKKKKKIVCVFSEVFKIELYSAFKIMYLHVCDLKSFIRLF